MLTQPIDDDDEDDDEDDDGEDDDGEDDDGEDDDGEEELELLMRWTSGRRKNVRNPSNRDSPLS